MKNMCERKMWRTSVQGTSEGQHSADTENNNSNGLEHAIGSLMTADSLIPTSRPRAWDQIPRWSSQRPACGWQTHPPSASCSNSLLPVSGRYPHSSTLGANIRGQLRMTIVCFFLGKTNELEGGQLCHNRPWGGNYSLPPPPQKKWKSCSSIQT